MFVKRIGILVREAQELLLQKLLVIGDSYQQRIRLAFFQFGSRRRRLRIAARRRLGRFVDQLPCPDRGRQRIGYFVNLLRGFGVQIVFLQYGRLGDQ